MKGIDVSKYQGFINWNAVSSRVDFAILRAGFGWSLVNEDPRFEHNYEQCKKYGIPVGAYWYSYAKTPREAEAEAAVCIEVLKGKQFEFPIWFDQEDSSIAGCSKATLTECVIAFCSALEKAGYYCGLYASRDWVNNRLQYTKLKAYDLWVAAWSNEPGNVKLPYGMWQNSSTGSIPGIVGNVDTDIAYKNYPDIIIGGGFNGFKKETASNELKTLKIGPMSAGDCSKFENLAKELKIKVEVI